MNQKPKNRVVVGLSGGVDSSVAAMLLKEQGYDVIGVFLKFWTPNFFCEKCDISANKCCDYDALNMARRVSEKLNIPFYVINASKNFKKEVVDEYLRELESGRTPNPCATCNKTIKFGFLLDEAKKLGANYVATGHYARLSREIRMSKSEIRNKLQIYIEKGKDKKKDQSYFLWQLTQDQLNHIIFPLGDLTKNQVRALAKKYDLPTKTKKDSQDVCFIPENGKEIFYKTYIKSNNKPGKIIDSEGNILGKHNGLVNYTIGQRHRLNGIQIKEKNGFVPAYVIKLDVDKNQLVVGKKEELQGKTLQANRINFGIDFAKIKCKAKIRYGAKEELCEIIKKNSDRILVNFKNKCYAITPGQSIVFYKADKLIGGGIIKS